MSGLFPRWAALALILTTLGACQSTPPRPLFQPLEAGAQFGYSEKQIDDTHWQVTYTGPRYRSAYGDTARQGDVDAARAQAYDLALWRAAQIALEHDHSKFSVVTERRDVDNSTEIDRHYPGYPYPFGYRRAGFWGWPPYYDDYDVRSWSQATVALTIDLNPAPGAQVLDAKETAARLEDQYAFKTWPPK
jgi:hypothetical protein